jgi:phospholipid/cholesterol/gamma-HCH transport system ATP-binding protein
MAIRFKNVHKSFNTKKVLDDVSFTVENGEVFFILGRSGVGKSVTLKSIVGLLKPESGEIHVNNIPIHHLSEPDLFSIRKICGMVFQHPALFDSVDVYENIAFGIQDLSNEEIKKRVFECLQYVQLSTSVLNQRPYELSFGMQKRVSLARSIAPAPEYLLYDEPTTSLDPITTTAINELISRLAKQLRVTSIVVSHDMPSALKLADKILVLDAGKVAAYGSAEEIKSSSHPLIKKFLVGVV